MFETSVVQTQAKATGRRVSLFSISVIAHTAVILGAVAVSVASVDFPRSAPDEYARIQMLDAVQIPPPLGNPNGGARPETKAAPPPPTPQPKGDTAPAIIPDDVPVADVASTGDNTTGNPTGTVPGPVGQPWGDPNSVGDPNALPSPNTAVLAAPQPNKIYEAYEVKAPVAIFKPAPPYPQVLIKAKIPATVVVRCIIDKNGHVRDPQVTLAARMSPFNDAVLAAVKQWRFTPGSLNGEAVETYLSLTVNFAVK